MKYIISALIVSLFLSSCTSSHTTLQPQEKKEVKKTAIKAIKYLGKTLQRNLKKVIKSHGIAGGANFCSKRASIIETKINKKLKKGITIKRISLKNRNTNNYPKNSDEIQILKQFEKNKSKKLIIKKIKNNHYKVYKPIYMGGKCLACHGDSQSRHKQAYYIIKDHYPKDKAINYKKGDFRGAFLVEIIK
jgi:PBP1b-binding outer membrane lipoprotein LpoB